MVEGPDKKEEIITHFLEISKGEDLTSPKAPLQKEIVKLDDLYWSEVEALTIQQVKEGQERILFNKYERFVIDAGLLDDRLIGSNAHNIKNSIMKELYAESEPTLFYFSQWIADRYKSFLAIKKVETSKETTTAKKSLKLNDVTQKLSESRMKVYSALVPYFHNLPGVKTDIIETLTSGRLDTQIETFAIQNRDLKSAKLEDQHTRLIDLKYLIIARAKSHCEDQRILKLFDIIPQIDEKIASEINSGACSFKISDEDEKNIKSLSLKEKIDFIGGELKLVRSLIKLGTTGSGITKTRSVLIGEQKRIAKPDVKRIIEQIREVDPKLPGNPNILIAPYIGTGFFEWDRYTIFVPLVSTRSEEESIVNAIANYRIMIDNLQNKGSLKKAYERKFGATNFRENFIKDYKDYVLGLGKGFRGALDTEKFRFFKEHIGPSSDKLFAPARITNLSPNDTQELLKKCRTKINRQEAEFEDHYTLGVLYSLEHRYQEALDQMAISVKINPTDGRAMFSLAYLCKILGLHEKAKRAFQETINIAPNTIWQVYASDILSKMD